MGETAAAVGGDQHRVLDPDAAVLGEVHTRLDRHDLALAELRIGGAGEPGRFVDVEAHAVAGAVQERVAPPGPVDHGPAHLVDVPARDLRPDRLDARLLRGCDHLEHAPLRLGRLDRP